MKHLYRAAYLVPFFLAACSSTSDGPCAIDDNNCDGVPDDLGTRLNDSKGNWMKIDFNGDGVGDGLAVDTNGDRVPDGALIDTDGDGLGDSVDTDGDNVANLAADYLGGGETGSGGSTTQMGSGGMQQASGGSGSGGEQVTPDGSCLLSGMSPTPGTTTSDQYYSQAVKRAGLNYMFIANGWGDGWQSHSIKTTSQGTAFEIVSFSGNETGQGVPAGYPSVFCGKYSDKTSGECGLTSPLAVSAITSLQTGLRWSHPAGDGKYNVAYDVWMSNGNSNLSGYFMVWLRDPAGAQPAGRKTQAGVTVANVPGTWDIWTGSVNGHPIVNYVRPESSPTHELSFDLKDFFDHAQANGVTLPGTHVISVAVGAEIWSGPVTGLKFEDFCVDVN